MYASIKKCTQKSGFNDGGGESAVGGAFPKKTLNRCGYVVGGGGETIGG